jgi:hypothetical protein
MSEITNSQFYSPIIQNGSKGVKMITLTFADGQSITNLIANGDVFVSTTPVNTEIFEDDNDSLIIVIDSQGSREEHTDWKFANVIHTLEGEYWICFSQVTPLEQMELDIQAKLDYIAMMADIDIDM